MYYQGYKVRLLPTAEQEKLFFEKANAVRFIWNYGLAFQLNLFQENKPHISDYKLMSVIRELKKQEEYSWLEKVGSHIINQTCLDLGQAFQKFFTYRKSGGPKYRKRCTDFTALNLIGHPKFKTKKHCKVTFPVRGERTRFYDEEHCSDYMARTWGSRNLVLIENVGCVRYQSKFNLFSFSEKVCNPRVSLVGNKWILSFTIEQDENQVQLHDYSCGIDVGVKNLATVSCGGNIMVFKNPNKNFHIQREKKRLLRLKHRAFSCQEDSKRRDKAFARYLKLSRHINNSRENYTHECSSKVIKMLPRRIVVEQVNINSWAKPGSIVMNFDIYQSNVGKFLRQLEYKAQNNGIQFIKADKYYPSSQICSCCGFRQGKLSLDTRIFRCSSCGLELDRDVNAAINLEHYSYK